LVDSLLPELLVDEPELFDSDLRDDDSTFGLDRSPERLGLELSTALGFELSLLDTPLFDCLFDGLVDSRFEEPLLSLEGRVVTGVDEGRLAGFSPLTSESLFWVEGLVDTLPRSLFPVFTPLIRRGGL
jgi:hypothetical protein